MIDARDLWLHNAADCMYTSCYHTFRSPRWPSELIRVAIAGDEMVLDERIVLAERLLDHLPRFGPDGYVDLKGMEKAQEPFTPLSVVVEGTLTLMRMPIAAEPSERVFASPRIDVIEEAGFRIRPFAADWRAVTVASHPHAIVDQAGAVVGLITPNLHTGRAAA